MPWLYRASDANRPPWPWPWVPCPCYYHWLEQVGYSAISNLLDADSQFELHGQAMITEPDVFQLRVQDFTERPPTSPHPPGTQTSWQACKRRCGSWEPVFGLGTSQDHSRGFGLGLGGWSWAWHDNHRSTIWLATFCLTFSTRLFVDLYLRWRRSNLAEYGTAQACLQRHKSIGDRTV